MCRRRQVVARRRLAGSLGDCAAVTATADRLSLRTNPGTADHSTDFRDVKMLPVIQAQRRQIKHTVIADCR